MKLVTSAGDYWQYTDSNLPDTIRHFKGGKFKNINLELPTGTPAFFSDDDNAWKTFADELVKAREEAGVNVVVAHAPCLHNPIFEALEDHNNAEYTATIRALRRSIEVCHYMGIDRVVVHACCCDGITKEQFYAYNKMFYNDLLDLAEKYNIILMAENWDGKQYYFSTGEVMREFLDFMHHPLLCACWDTAHGNIDLVAREIGQYENIVALGDKLKGLHISDNFGDSHHHTWPFAGVINFDSIMQGLLDVNYDGYFTFEASYTLFHQNNPPFGRKAWEHNGETVSKLQSPPLFLKKQAVDLLYEIGKYLLQTYDCFEE